MDICKFWIEIDDEIGTTEYCKKNGHSCSCFGDKADCDFLPKESKRELAEIMSKAEAFYNNLAGAVK